LEGFDMSADSKFFSLEEWLKCEDWRKHFRCVILRPGVARIDCKRCNYAGIFNYDSAEKKIGTEATLELMLHCCAHDNEEKGQSIPVSK
jgi:hypothetical protein